MKRNPLRDSEEVVGYIRIRPVYDKPEPVRVTWRDVFGALAGFIVFSALFVGVWIWMAIIDAGVNGPNQWTP